MSNVLVLVEHAGKELKKAALGGITCGQQMAAKTGGQLHLLLLGDGANEAAPAAQNFGASKVYTITGADFSHLHAEVVTQALVAAQAACQATHVAAAATSLSKDCLPRFAARIDGAIATDIIEVIDKSTYKRPMWAGNVIATVALAAEKQIVTVRTTDFAAPQTGAASPIEALSVTCSGLASRVKCLSSKEIKSERPDVTTAERVVSGGRGVKSAEGFSQVEKLADAIGAGVGASRAVCDAGWVSNDLQIGQTGKVVAPNLYIAVGISGAIQHLAGMKGSKTIVAINQDPEAPIFQVADYGLVQDLFKAVPELITGLSR